MKPSELSELDLLQVVADQYRTEGYRVRVRPASSSLPHELAGFQPDLVASRGEENVVVEVKRGKTAKDVTSQLAQLTARARAIGWRVDLVSEPEPEGAHWSRRRRQALLAEAVELLDADHKEAALLLAAAAAEGALRALARRHQGLPVRNESIRQLIDSLRSFGLIGPSVSSVLSRLAEARNQTAHALSMGRMSPNKLREGIEVAIWLDSSSFLTPDEMADWFLADFEDPAQWVPYDSHEGGYQYPPGEPHDAREVLHGQYGTAPEAAVEDAAELIDPLGAEWVRKRR